MPLPRRSGSAPLIALGALACFAIITSLVYLASLRWPTAAPAAVALFASTLAVLGILRRHRKRKTWQKPLLRNLWITLIQSLPPGATSARLTLTSNDPTQPPILTTGNESTRLSFSPDLRSAIQKLESESIRRKDPWRQLIIRVHRDGKEWTTHADFDYGPQSPTPQPHPAT